MARLTRSVHGWRLLGIAVAAQACAGPPQQAASSGDECEARIIVTFNAPPDAGGIAALATASDTRLNVVNRLRPDLYVLDLAARGGQSACTAALERLRRDARVRSAEFDTRRAPSSG
jgi:hypothetical protein